MTSNTPSLAERIASLALATFESLPLRCKPRVVFDGKEMETGKGKREWTPLSAVVLRIGNHEDEDGEREGEGEVLKCVALG